MVGFMMDHGLELWSLIILTSPIQNKIPLTTMEYSTPTFKHHIPFYDQPKKKKEKKKGNAPNPIPSLFSIKKEMTYVSYVKEMIWRLTYGKY